MKLMFRTGLVVFLIDQIIKFFVLFQVFGLQWAQVRVPSALLPYPDPVDVAAPYLVLRMAWNRGINFGLFAGYNMRWVLIAVACAITIGVVWWLSRTKASKWTYLAAGLLIGGAMGNVIDRVLYGAVADFLNMSCCGFTNPYAFNVADIAIFIGAVGLALLSDDKKKAA